MTPGESRGYRVRRLRDRRTRRRRRGELGIITLLAAGVALGAVLGAYFITKYLTREEVAVDARSSLVLLTIGNSGNRPRPVACAGLFDVARGSWRLYTLPRALLLEGSQGEYVMAGDLMGRNALRRDLKRALGVAVGTDIRLTYAGLRRVAGGRWLTVTLSQPVTLRVGGVWRTYEGSVRVRTNALAEMLGASGESGEDEDAMARACLAAVFHTAALRPVEERRRLVHELVSGISDEAERLAASQVLSGLLRSGAAVERIPSDGAVTQGQFAFRLDNSRLMAEVVRRIPGYAARYTVLVRNGTGEVGVGDLVRRKLAVLNVNLPASSNAESFNYEHTQILAGSDALTVAEDIRAILGRGVVLRGDALPSLTLEVIVGADLKAEDLQ